jgi:hypothetical protein
VLQSTKLDKEVFSSKQTGMDMAHGFHGWYSGSDEEEGSLPRGEVNREYPGKSKDQRMPSRFLRPVPTPPKKPNLIIVSLLSNEGR